MRYVIMCGGKYNNFKSTPKQFIKVNGEAVVMRTIRLLKENGIDTKDIVITSNNPIFEQCGVRVVTDPANTFSQDKSFTNMKGYWVNAFYRYKSPTCYLFGDVFYSESCIKIIVNTKTTDISFFSTVKPFARNYTKNHVEPLAFKVVDTEKFFDAVDLCKKLFDAGKTWRHPIAFDVWCAVKGFPLNYDYLKKQTADVFGEGFVPIYDYSCDIDDSNDAKILEQMIFNKQHESKTPEKSKRTAASYLYF